jgi:hypothetical protein
VGGGVNPDRVQRAAEVAYILLVMGVAAVLWLEAGRLPPAPYDPLGPGAFPRWTAYGMVALGMAMAIRLLLGRQLGQAAQSLVAGLDGNSEHPLRPWIAVLTLVLALAYAAALSVRAVPFLLATGAYLFLAGAILGPLKGRRLLVVAAVAAVAAIVLDLLFRRVFGLDLS